MLATCVLTGSAFLVSSPSAIRSIKVTLLPSPSLSSSTTSSAHMNVCPKAHICFGLSKLLLKVVQVWTLNLPHLVKHCAYLRRRADGSGQWIKHQGIACGLFLALE